MDIHEKLDKLEAKLDSKFDKLNDTLIELVIQTARNTDSLEDHMQQTVEVRKQTGLIAADLSVHKVEDLKIHAKVNTFMDRFKFLGTILGTSGAILYALHAMGILDKIILLFSP